VEGNIYSMIRISYRKRIYLGLVALMVMASFGYYYFTKGANHAATNGATITPPWLLLTITDISNRSLLNSPKVIKVTISNISGMPVALMYGQLPYQIDFTVRMSSGILAPLTRYGEAMKATSNLSSAKCPVHVLKLRAGAEKSFNIHLDRVVDISIPGTYTVQARASFPVVSGSNRSYLLSSNTIAVENDGNAEVF